MPDAVDRRLPFWLLFALLATFLLWLTIVLVIVQLNEGKFIYTLDDPYIHLALAENILRGHYGINLEDASSPSSSILFPFILALLMFVRLIDLGPLAINLAALLTTVVVLWRILRHTVLGEADPYGRLSALSVLLLVVCFNVLGVTLTGMEHSLHALLTVLTCLGLFSTTERGRPPGWLVAVLILQPLVRFEGMAIFIAGVWFLVGLGHRRPALIGCVVLGLCLASYAVLMASLGLPILPSAVLVKSTGPMASLGDGMLGLVTSALRQVVGVIRRPDAAFCSVTLVLLLFWLFFREGFARTPRSLLLQAAVAPIALHFLFGRFGWLHRYEIYINLYAALVALYLFRDRLRQWIGSINMPEFGLASVILLFLFVQKGPANLLKLPLAANNIYEQQYQMHRFVTEFYVAPVAVNDIGYVSYRNDQYVLDLWGLGSETARRLRRENPPNWVSELARQHGVTLAMVYDTWLGDMIPKSWRKVAVLSSSKLRISVAEADVSFYVATPDACDQVVQRLMEFKVTLPQSVTLVIRDAACSQ